MILEVIYIAVFILLALLTFKLLPGPFLVSVAMFIYGIHTNFSKISILQITVIFVVGLLATLVDNIFSMLGTRKFGGSKYAMLGALFGTFLVFFIGPAGFILGPFLGAFLVEVLVSKKQLQDAAKASLGAVLGMFSGIVAKFVISLGMILAFAVIVF